MDLAAGAGARCGTPPFLSMEPIMIDLGRFAVLLMCLTLRVASAASWDEVWLEQDAEELVRAGQLQRVLLTPEAFGGRESSDNMVFLPPAASREKEDVTRFLLGLSLQGAIDHVSFEAVRRGPSLVPASIVVRAWNAKVKNGYTYVKSIEVR